MPFKHNVVWPSTIHKPTKTLSVIQEAPVATVALEPCAGMASLGSSLETRQAAQSQGRGESDFKAH